MDKIDRFDGEYRWLSNFAESAVEFEGIQYPTVEHAYQAAKTLSKNDRAVIAGASTPGLAKRMGQQVLLRKDWENIKLQVMGDLLVEKFTKHADLKQQLLDTGDTWLIEGNYWGDTFWGVCRGKGENMLGLMLMFIRQEIKEGRIQ